MLTVQTIGSVDAKRKLPAPKQYVAIAVVWSVLFLLADTGLGRLAARLSVVMLLTAAVVGPFGARAIKFLETIAKRFAVASGGTDKQPSEILSTDNPQYS